MHREAPSLADGERGEPCAGASSRNDARERSMGALGADEAAVAPPRAFRALVHSAGGTAQETASRVSRAAGSERGRNRQEDVFDVAIAARRREGRAQSHSFARVVRLEASGFCHPGPNLGRHGVTSESDSSPDSGSKRTTLRARAHEKLVARFERKPPQAG